MTSSLTITIHSTAPRGTDDLLRRVVWGTKGGLQYRVLNDRTWNTLPKESQFLAAYRDDRLVGVYLLSRQPWGFLRQLLAVAPEDQGTGVGRALVERAAQWARAEGTCVAGTIESTNRRSLELSLRASYEQVAHFEVCTFTRQRPRMRPGVRQPHQDERDVVVAALAAQEHSWFDPSQVDVSRCWVTSDLSSGLQLVPQRWELTSLGLPMVDALVMRLLPLLGTTPQDFHFATGHYWWGKPQAWEALLEHAMHIEGFQAVVLTGDEKSPHWRDLRRHVHMGAVGSAIGRESMEVTASSPFPAPLMFTPLHAL